MANYFVSQPSADKQGQFTVVKRGKEEKKNTGENSFPVRRVSTSIPRKYALILSAHTNQPNRAIAQNIPFKPSSSPLLISILGLVVTLAGLMLRSSYISHQPLTGMQLRYLHHVHVFISGM